MPQMIVVFRRLLFKSKQTAGWLLVLLLMILGTAAGSSGKTEETNYTDCLACHQGIAPIGPGHTQSCAACHLVPALRRAEVLKTHDDVVRNPSDPAHVEQFCLPCHKTEIQHVQAGLHFTMAGIINQTRYLWGAQPVASPAIHGLGGSLKPLPVPDPALYPDTPARLVDDFLRRRCLRCHLHAKGAQGQGFYRASGCAACHMPYNDGGTYQGRDTAIDPSARGYPARHTFTTKIPDSQCRHCHSPNRVGADYAGLFQHDYSDTYRSPRINGRLKPRRYGLYNHSLSKDIHAERGLWCIDCHEKEDVMGDGHVYDYESAVPKRTCGDCHGGFGNASIQDAGGVHESSGQRVLISKGNGKTHPIPEFDPNAPGHQIPAHERVRCSACHAQWSYQDYGLSVIREDVIADYKWVHLTAQGDPYLEKRLNAYTFDRKTVYPVSKDRVSGQLGPGIWSMGWRFRRWEFMPLGVDQWGKYAIIRPLYQYRVSYVDRLGDVVLDNVTPSRGDGSGRGWAFMPYVPHTTAPVGRACIGCHQNRVAVGDGIQDGKTLDTLLTIPSPPAIPSMRLLSASEKEHLLNPSSKWHRKRFRARRPLLNLLAPETQSPETSSP